MGESCKAAGLLQVHHKEAVREETRLRRKIKELKAALHDKLAPVKVRGWLSLAFGKYVHVFGVSGSGGCDFNGHIVLGLW